MPCQVNHYSAISALPFCNKPTGFLLLLTFWAQLGFAQVDFVADTTSGCSPLLVNFTPIAPTAVSWSWDLGGQVSSLQNPGRIYSTSGQYTISLTITDASGMTFTQTKTNYITVFQGPSADIGINKTQACKGETLTFSDLTTAGTGMLTDWLWDFGDGTSSTLQNPTHVYGQTGTFNVSLFVKDANGCEDIVARSQYVTIQAPDANFSANPFSGCNPPLTVQFFPATTSGTHFWDFGNTNTSTTASPSHTYTLAGRYDVTHIVVDNLGCRDTLVRNNMVSIGQNTTTILVSDTVICLGDTLNFSGGSATASSASWNFGNGTTSIQRSPNYAFSAPGLYTVTVALTEPTGCVLNGSINIRVLPPPAVDFMTPDTIGCENPWDVQFMNLTPQTASLRWDFGNGLTSVVPNAQVTYFFPNNYDIKLTVTDTNGCIDSLEKPGYVKVGSITSDFVASPSEGCAPLDVAFSLRNFSPRNNPPQPNWPMVTGYYWDFGDGTTSTQANPTHTYSTKGLYDILLIITNTGGCTDTFLRKEAVQVGEKPIASFNIVPDTGCAKTVFQFTNTTTGNVTVTQWMFGDGGDSPSFDASYSYKDTGTFIVTLIVSDRGCKDTLTDSVLVLLPVSRFILSPIKACDTPATVTFTDLSLGADTWLWDFDDGNTSTLQNPVHTFIHPGNYNITLTVTNNQTGCDHFVSHTFQALPLDADFTLDTLQGCAPLTVNFQDHSFNATFWDWRFGDGNTSGAPSPSHTYTEPGIYYPGLFIKNAIDCGDFRRDSVPILVGNPAAGFMADDTVGCNSLTVAFTDTSTSTLPILGWNWDLGNGTSTMQHPTATYTGQGYRDIQLIVTDSAGCKDTATYRDLLFISEPIADFIANYPINCPLNPLIFQNRSLGQGLTYFWDFGDGFSSTQVNPAHFYSQVGQYTVSLTVTDQYGCDTTFIRPNYITIAAPQIDFTADTTYSNCPPLLVNFMGQALSPHPFSTWQWDLGNMNQGFTQNVSTLYTDPGTYSVNLIAIAPSGCRDTVDKPQYIQVDGPSGNFSFAPNQGCPGLQVNFSALGQGVSIYEWDMDDGRLEVGQNVQHTYHVPGTYHPRLILQDSLGCRIFVDHPDSIVIVTPSQADFSLNTPIVCDSGFVSFLDQSSPIGSIVSWLWDFGDQTTANIANPTHYYASLNPYDVQLIITDVNGCKDTVLKAAAVQVVPSPVVKILPSDPIGCPPFTVHFQDISPATNGSILTRTWDFGNGSLPSSMVNDSATYGAGTYTVSLTLVDAFGCSADTQTTVTVRPPPLPAFTVSDTIGCAPLTVFFVDQTPGQIAQWFWDFGDGGTSNAQHPSHIYLKDSVFDVRLRVIDIYGCENEVTIPQLINLSPKPTPVVDAGPPIIEICDGDTVQLMGTVTNALGTVRYEWTPAQGLSNYQVLSPIAHPDFTTTYFFSAFHDGCRHSVADSVTVIVHSRPTVSPGNAYTICHGDSAQLSGAAGGDWDPNTGYRFMWSPAVGLSSTTIPKPFANPTQTTTYTLYVTSSHGCESDPFQAKVDVIPRPNAMAGPDDTLCFGDTIMLNGTHTYAGGAPPDGTTFYDWQPNQQMLGSFTPRPGVSPDSSITYSLKVSYLGCVSYDSVEVTVLAAARADASSLGHELCSGDSIPLAAGALSPTATYQWSPAFGLSDPQSPSTWAFPQKSTTYVLTVSELKCEATDSVKLTVYPTPEVELYWARGENCEELEAKFWEETRHAQFWTWDFGDGTPISNDPNPTHIYAEKGRYDVTVTAVGQWGCEAMAETVVEFVGEPGDAFFTSIPPIGTEILFETEIAFFDQSKGAVAWHWTFGDGESSTEQNPVHVYYSGGEYTVTLAATDTLGCVHYFTQTPYVIFEGTVDIPNVFTPNQDGINDIFLFEYSGNEPMNWTIYDRWGTTIFTNNGDPTLGWDGTMANGNNAVEGVYFYALKIGEQTFTGNVTLLR